MGFKPEEFVSTIYRYRCRKNIRKDIGRVQNERHLRERMIFATSSGTKPEQASQSKTGNSASNYKAVCLNDKLLAGPDLQHRLIGTIFRFRKGSMDLRVDIESMFQQVKFPSRIEVAWGFFGVHAQRRNASYCNKSSTEQFLQGKFHQNGRNSWRSNWSCQQTRTCSLAPWIRIEEVDKQQPCSYQTIPEDMRAISNTKQV